MNPARPTAKSQGCTITGGAHTPLANPIPLVKAKERIGAWLAFGPGENRAIDVALATKLANDIPGDPVFTVLVGPSSGAKTEIIRAFRDVPGMLSLGSLTPRTFASGFDPERASLLAQIPTDTHTIAIKDLGVILAMSPNDRGELLQQLRDIFDGYFRRDWGTGKGALEWTGRLGLLAGATPAIEREFSTLAALGERFLFFRMRVGSRASQARRALEISGHEKSMREEIHSAIAGALAAIPSGRVEEIGLSAQPYDVIGAIADVLTHARTPVVRNRFDKTVEYLPALEAPARAAKELLKLGKALAALYGQKEIGSEELQVLAQIGADSIPSARARILALLLGQPSDAVVTAKVAGATLGLPTVTTSRLFEDLAVLGIVTRIAASDSYNAPFDVRLASEFAGLLDASGVGRALLRAYPYENAVRANSPTAKSEGHSRPTDSKVDLAQSAEMSGERLGLDFPGGEGPDPGLPLAEDEVSL